MMITVVRQLSTYLHVHGIIYFSLPPQSTLNSWCLPLLKQCEDYLSAIVHKHKDPAPSEAGQAGYSLNEQAEHEAIRYLFTLGEVAHVSNVHAEYVFICTYTYTITPLLTKFQLCINEPQVIV